MTSSDLVSVAVVLAMLALMALVERLIPLRARGPWSARHVGPNLALMATTLAGNLALNGPMIAGLVWAGESGLGILNRLALPVAMEIALAVLALDLVWYVTHRAMHAVQVFWRFHAIHHSDPAVDATTAIRQHPGEVLIRVAFLAPAALLLGVSVEAFALYRVWTAVHGFFAHANLALPLWADSALSAVFVSPNMHKSHHAQTQPTTDTNFGNIFAVWDRIFRTFTPAAEGVAVRYGLKGADDPRGQTLVGLLRGPFQSARSD